MKKLIKKPSKEAMVQKSTPRKELEKKTVEGAKKALKEYKRVFKRLAEFDRA